MVKVNGRRASAPENAESAANAGPPARAMQQQADVAGPTGRAPIAALPASHHGTDVSGGLPGDPEKADLATQPAARLPTRLRLAADTAYGLSWSVQGVVLAWTIWLGISWVMLLGAESYQPAARWMVFSSLAGMMGIWPAWRLSQGGGRGAWRQTAIQVFLEWLALAMVFQVVLWPLCANMDWKPRQTLVLDAAVAGWSLLTAALVALGCASRRGVVRTAVMAGCMVLLLGEPAGMALINVGAAGRTATTWTMRLSPLETIWALTAPGALEHSGAWLPQVVGILLIGTLIWMLILAWPDRSG